MSLRVVGRTGWLLAGHCVCQLGRAVVSYGMVAVAGVGHRVDQREIVDEVGMSGRFLRIRWVAFFHVGVEFASLFAASGPIFLVQMNLLKSSDLHER